MTYARLKGVTCIVLLIAVFSLISTDLPVAADYPEISGPCNPSFPKDHASHPEYRTEWWYYTGNLKSAAGELYGFQLTFFRLRTAPPASGERPPGNISSWRAGQLYAAHAAISDISSGVFRHSEKTSRGALEMAGVKEGDGRVEVFVHQWRATIMPELHSLSADEPGFSFSLDLRPAKEPVLHGDSGYSRKGEEPSESSCYYSITRFEAKGKVAIDGIEKEVQGTAWMDHEFASAPIAPNIAGWDWFSIQLSDGSDLMLYLMRNKSGGYSAVSSGTFVGKDGRTVHLSVQDFRAQVLSEWKSPHTGAVYPASWLIEIPLLGLRLNVSPNLTDQEMQTPLSARITYWEGSVRAEGTGRGGHPVSGAGYVELTGYAGPMEF